MAFKTNIKKAVQKSEEERARAAAQAQFGRPNVFYSPKGKENLLRFLPPWTDKGPNAEQFWREIWVHWRVRCMDEGGDTAEFRVPCPRKSPGTAELLGLDPDTIVKCPICNQLEKLKGSTNPVDVDMVKTMRAKMRFISQIIDVNDPVWTEQAIEELKVKGTSEEFLPTAGDPKIQIYEYGPKVFNGILDYYQDQIDITDLEEGYNVKLFKKGEGINSDYRVRIEMKPSKAPITEEVYDAILWNIDEQSPFYTEEQMDAILAGATKEEIKELRAGTTDESKLLPTADNEEPEEEVEEPTEEEETVEEETVEEEETETKEDEWSPPVDEDGDIIYEELTDEQIEDPSMEQYVVNAGTDNEQTPYIECYGIARQIKPDDDGCKKDCGLFDRCTKRVAFLDKKAAEEAAKKKKRPPAKKAKPAAKKKVGKPKSGNGAPEKVKEETALSIEDEMRASLGR